MTDWEKALKTHKNANFLQSEPWEKKNDLLGNKCIKEKIGESGLALMIVRNAKRARYLEVAGGPLIDWNDKDAVKTAKKVLLKTAKENHCTFVRFRPQLEDTPENLEILKKMGAKIAPMHLAAEHTVILDLEKSEDELLAKMRRQTRYEVKRGEKLGLKVENSNSKEIFEEFFKVQTETAKRQHFFAPSLKELLAEREAFGDNISIYVTKTGKNTILKDKKYEENLPVAYGLVFHHGEEAEYFEAASTDLNRSLPGAYALQWQVIKDLKKKGLKRYNLWGIAPPNSKNHRYSGVTTFKTGFGGEVVNFIPAHDLVLNKLKYLPNLIIEKIRKKRRHL